MKRIIFLAILSALLVQGCSTKQPGKSADAAAPAAKQEVKAPVMDPVKIMTDANIGNCAACHSIPSDQSITAGDIGPPFYEMKTRFPDIEKLKANIADQKAFKSETIMPPFGRNKILTPEQIDVIAKHIYQY
jgi:sulfur-oxidizing protein SoxX